MIDKIVDLMGYTGGNDIVNTLLPLLAVLIVVIFGVEFVRLMYNIVFSIFGKGGYK